MARGINVEDLLSVADSREGGTDGVSVQNKSENQKLFILIIDGFRWDYFEHFEEDELPGFKMLTEKGVKNDYLQPVFPSYSFPNFLLCDDRCVAHQGTWSTVMVFITKPTKIRPMA